MKLQENPLNGKPRCRKLKCVACSPLRMVEKVRVSEERVPWEPQKKPVARQRSKWVVFTPPPESKQSIKRLSGRYHPRLKNHQNQKLGQRSSSKNVQWQHYRNTRTIFPCPGVPWSWPWTFQLTPWWSTTNPGYRSINYAVVAANPVWPKFRQLNPNLTNNSSIFITCLGETLFFNK